MTAETTETARAARTPRRIHAPLVELSLSRFREFGREPGAIFWTFGFPILLTIALGIAFRSQGPQKVAVGIIEGPRSAQTAEILERTPGLAVERLTQERAAELLHTGKVSMLIEPSAQPGGPVTYRFDPSRPDAQASRMVVDEALQRAAGRVDPQPVREEKVSSPGARYVDWLVPGLLGMQLMSGSLWGMAWGIVQARQRKLLKRYLATPMHKRDYLLAFLLSRLVFLLVEVPVLLGFAYVAFGVEIRGAIGAVALVTVLGAASFAGLGFLCAARAQNTETANGLVNLVSLPMFVVSGVFFASTRFPAFIQPVIRFLPLTALNEALRAVINDGTSLFQLPLQLGVMALWAVVSFVVALRLFRWV